MAQGLGRIRASARLREELGAARYREEDRRAVARLAAGALDGSVEGWEEHYDPEKNSRLDPEQVYVVEEDGDIRATAAVLPLEVFVDGEPVSMGGIADIATHPAYRRRGYVGELTRAGLGGMRERGIHLPCSIPSPIPSTAATAGSSPPKR
ncbi:MAG: hypothetical protein AVDCRST_MAG80-1403 [uncultured Rubrobacteraceae bacterium]|uniref:N-acetyltransferase domain-containing protein n=1 Tax=uncultured Rubrobacteraceae bacterium TaxID=349277 RepID=A0A6J4QFK4_9ACTN|nr:MAG: hypothetical protein AVDCRST_MAG80-1403 [uncultured Rubrobacteraceae bacterium]